MPSAPPSSRPGRPGASASLAKRTRWFSSWLLWVSLVLASDAHAQPQIEGQWGTPIAWPEIAVSAANLPDGRVLTWSSELENDFPATSEFTHASIFDPATGNFVTADSNFHDMFCAGISMLEDGTVLASGGNPFDRRTSAFDPTTMQWQPAALMNFNRWYGTSLVLATNQVFQTFALAGGATSERYDAAQDFWAQTPGATMQDLLTEQILLNALPPASTASDLQWYGQMAVAPDGRVFHGGPTPTWHIFDPNLSGGVLNLGQPGGTRARMWGNAVSYAPGKVLLLGGTDRTLTPSTTDAAYSVDLNGPSPVVTAVSPMSTPRAFQNAVTLPTGEVLVIGGNTSGELFSDVGSQLAAEVWDPVADSWQVLASMTVPRNYHSTALLLNDGRVLSAGGGVCGVGCAANHQDGEIFSPPYLFDATGALAARPTIDTIQSPAETTAGAVVTLTATGAIDRFTMIRLSGTTHAINTDHRFMEVSSTPDGLGGYDLAMHANPNVLIPGYYWIFAIDTNDEHSRKVACVTCHVPALARGGRKTKTWWDWSTAGRKDANGEPLVTRDEDGYPTYDYKKGTFRWEQDLAPEYYWFDGEVRYSMIGDRIDDGGVVSINQIDGRFDDPASRIWPFKVMRGKQPYDRQLKVLAVPHLFGKDEDAYWRSFDWDDSVRAGMAAVGMEFSGDHGFVETEYYWPVTHMVAPKEDALRCADCHARDAPAPVAAAARARCRGQGTRRRGPRTMTAARSGRGPIWIACLLAAFATTACGGAQRGSGPAAGVRGHRSVSLSKSVPGRYRQGVHGSRDFPGHGPSRRRVARATRTRARRAHRPARGQPAFAGRQRRRRHRRRHRLFQLRDRAPGSRRLRVGRGYPAGDARHHRGAQGRRRTGQRADRARHRARSGTSRR